MLKEIHRRKSATLMQQNIQFTHLQATNSASIASESSTEPCIDHQVGKFVYEGEIEENIEGKIERLKHDRCVLMAEVMRLRQEQHNVDQVIRSMVDRVQAAERRQEQMMAFLANAMHNSDFLSHLRQHAEKFQINLDRDVASRKRKQLLSGSTDQTNVTVESSGMSCNAGERCNIGGIMQDTLDEYGLEPFNTELETYNTESESYNPESEAYNAESEAYNTELEVYNAKSGAYETKLGVPFTDVQGFDLDMTDQVKSGAHTMETVNNGVSTRDGIQTVNANVSKSEELAQLQHFHVDCDPTATTSQHIVPASTLMQEINSSSLQRFNNCHLVGDLPNLNFDLDFIHELSSGPEP